MMRGIYRKTFLVILAFLCVGIYRKYKRPSTTTKVRLEAAFKTSNKIIQEYKKFEEDLSLLMMSTDGPGVAKHTQDSPQESLEIMSIKKETSICPINKLHKKYNIPEFNMTCQPHKPSKSGCAYVAKKYRYLPEYHTCDSPMEQRGKIHICGYINEELICDGSSCKNNQVFIQGFDEIEGEVIPILMAENQKDLDKAVKYYGSQSIAKKYYFLFLSCANNPAETQLLLLKEDTKEMSEEMIPGKNIHINAVFLDSLARPHFYRSLQKTINTFNAINTDKYTGTEVLDFELFQSIHGHTHANNKALFSGQTFSNDDTHIEEKSTGIADFLTGFRKAGYYTMFQEDLCWLGYYGLSEDLTIQMRNYHDLRKKLKDIQLNQTGLTFSTCTILSRWDLKHPYNTDDKLCYNGVQYSSYYLRHTKNLFSSKIAQENTIFSYTSLNTPHDYRGTRIQTIDAELSHFVDFSSKQANVLTLIFADHGNSYSDYVFDETEGRYEQFQPSMFMILPQNVKNYLGDEAVHALRLNQKRLFTNLDLHQTFMSLKNKKMKGLLGPQLGLFQPLPLDRSCLKLPLRLPNLCQCEGWQTPVKNDTNFLAHVEFAVGKLNNIISQSPLINCKRIVAEKFEKVYQRNIDDVMITSFDIQVKPGKNSPNEHEIITFEIKSKTTKDEQYFEFISWDRLSKFAPYDVCSKSKTSVRFCVCDIVDESTISQTQKHNAITSTDKVTEPNSDDYIHMFFHRTSLYYTIFSKVQENQFVLVKDTLILIERKFWEDKEKDITSTFEIINTSKTQQYFVSVKFTKLRNMKTVTSCQDIVVETHAVTYICSIQRTRSFRISQYTFTYTFEEK